MSNPLDILTFTDPRGIPCKHTGCFYFGTWECAHSRKFLELKDLLRHCGVKGVDQQKLLIVASAVLMQNSPFTLTLAEFSTDFARKSLYYYDEGRNQAKDDNWRIRAYYGFALAYYETYRLWDKRAMPELEDHDDEEYV